MPHEQALRGGHDLQHRIVGIELGLVFEQAALERAAGRDAFDRRRDIGARGAQVVGAQRRCVDRHDARALQLGQQQQARRPHRHVERSLQFALPQHEEAAARRDGVDAFAQQRLPRLDERREQRDVTLVHHAPRRSAAHHRMAHRDVERRRMADVAAQAREPRVEHQDAEGLHGDASERAAAVASYSPRA